MIVTRFAPSPTGLLHLGHAVSALLGWRMARAAGGQFVLRIEDIDTTRCRPAFEAAILEDLAWLGVTWEGPVLRQSERLALYAEALDRLKALGVVYPCFCTRADIAAAGGAPQGPEGPLYPGTCRGLSAGEVAAKPGMPAWRLDVAKAAALAGPLDWEDAGAGRQSARPERLGDIVLARRDIGAAYHLAVVVDDAAQGITDVVRGADLFEATHVQRLLQALLGAPAPRYHHHALVTGADGKRLAKRDGGSTIAAARAAGEDPAALAGRLLSRWGDSAA
jgi:glutamyl-Q tRNA(Asp) synthetase